MKVIGLIGGMSWESTAVYYRLINQGVHQALGGHHNAKSIIYTLDFADVESCQTEGRWDDASALMVRAAEVLSKAGAEILILCTNTMHKVAASVSSATHARFIHIADATADEILKQGISRVGLLGTRYTMEQEFYRGRLEGRGLTVLIPDEQERDDVHRVIYDELCHGVVSDTSRARYQDVVRSLGRRGVDGVILGCTEIGLLLAGGDVDLPLFDTTVLHATAAVKESLSE